MIYFISDTHFNHDRDFIWGNRGYNSVNEMNENIIINWNNIITNEDDVYVVGDFFLGKDTDYIIDTINKLNGKIHLILGNHDTNYKVGIYNTLPHKIVSISYAKIIKYDNKSFYISHYPTLTATPECYNKTSLYNIFGHTHSKEIFYEGFPYMYNVACDAHNCTPISIEQICSDIDKGMQTFYRKKYHK